MLSSEVAKRHPVSHIPHKKKSPMSQPLLPTSKAISLILTKFQMRGSIGINKKEIYWRLEDFVVLYLPIDLNRLQISILKESNYNIAPVH